MMILEDFLIKINNFYSILLENTDLGSSLYCYFNINIWYYIFSNTLNLYLPTKI